MRPTVDFSRGEFVGAARALLTTYMALKAEAHSSTDNPDKIVVLDELMESYTRELIRLIGNAFQLRNELGDPVQLSLLILYMVGEEHIASGVHTR
jgi:hypothetical protein